MRRSLFLLPLLAALVPVPASACAVVADHPATWRESQRWARATVERATAIVDGEVIRAFGRDNTPALVRVHRVLKGPPQTELLVSANDGCDVILTNTGERLRLLLYGGPDIYFLGVDYSNARAEDRMLHSDRRRDWPYVRGTETAR